MLIDTLPNKYKIGITENFSNLGILQNNLKERLEMQILDNSERGKKKKELEPKNLYGRGLGKGGEQIKKQKSILIIYVAGIRTT